MVAIAPRFHQVQIDNAHLSAPVWHTVTPENKPFLRLAHGTIPTAARRLRWQDRTPDSVTATARQQLNVVPMSFKRVQLAPDELPTELAESRRVLKSRGSLGLVGMATLKMAMMKGCWSRS